MGPAGVSKGIFYTTAILGALLLTLTAAPARAGAFTFNPATNTYTYVGDKFNVCGFGCPENAPADPTGVDYIIATLVYGGKLAPNLTDAKPVPISWTMTDFFDAFSFGGNGLPPDWPGDVDDPPTPGLMVSTDGSGNIVKWVMSVFSGIINAEGRFEGTQAIILNPPIFCGEECGGGGITDFVGVNLLSDDSEWDAGVVVPAAPEPATLTLIAGGLLAIARRRLRRS